MHFWKREFQELKEEVARQKLSAQMRRWLELILKRNCFEFDGKFYLQTTGVSMGNNASPELSDISLFALEQEFVEYDPNIVFYKRYRDDILMAYMSSEEDFQNLINFMNRSPPTLRFTFDILDQQVTFLDLEIYKGARFAESGILDHRIHTKETDTFQFLPFDSAHPRSVFCGLIKGETIWFARECTHRQEFLDKVSMFADKLVDRGYKLNRVEEIMSEVNYDHRYRYIYSGKPPTGGKLPLVFVTKYVQNIKTSDLKQALLAHWNLIQNNVTLSKVFPESPILAYQCETNIRDMIVRSTLPVVDPPLPSVQPQNSGDFLDGNDRELIDILDFLKDDHSA